MTTLREAYDLIDRFLRNNLYDDDYAEYSEALELLSSEPPQRKPLTDDAIDKVTDAQWAQNNHKPIYAAHRAYARAIEQAHGIEGKE